MVVEHQTHVEPPQGAQWFVGVWPTTPHLMDMETVPQGILWEELGDGVGGPLIKTAQTRAVA